MSEKVKPHTFGGARFIGRDQIIPVKKVFIDSMQQRIEQLQAENAYLREEIENYRSTLDDGANLICESLGVDPEFYDRDQSDYACYSDMFEDAAKVILQSGIKWDGDDGEFKEKESE